jgi:hypothetical protein
MNRLYLASLASLVWLLSLPALADKDIDLGGKITTFTNLQGRVYENVRLEHGTLDGVIYSVTNGVGGGMVKYKDLSPDFLADLNIPTNRIQIAEQRDKVRAEQKARYDAAVRALALKQQQQEILDDSNALAQAKANAKTATAANTDQNDTAAKTNRKKR